MEFIQGLITRENMWIDLERLLDSVDADFTGANGEEYYADNGVAYMENAIEMAEKSNCDIEKIAFVIGECKEYSTNYYKDFEYTIIETKKGYEVVIATVYA